MLFFLVHTKGKSGIKIEISTREIEKVNKYELIEFYGTSMFVMKKEDIFANKLIALKNRHSASPRDLYDINYFFKQNWDISEKIVETVTGLRLLDYMKDLPKYIENNFNKETIHFGLGELVDNESQRDFVKNKLIMDTINQINFYIDSKKRGK
ncbi:hypothetical protein CO058_00825 [candidate division WWE3 bacterium CG_4_9_14_0_2_um_filter_35_11]|uniref:Uncharacterized protein n=1 Tax=candidate division WWE3 bacterium CG_4_9_14_0_2_um_filter_35_11 TaxID=1975077 RepID=A0A2M8EMI2_UNCKA|nr:MAG: hypothetical protein COV25_03865 [candidate division WWE3 bacterium CG10_big_fil_rev_8_21_14_0_10_35_32]PJC23940.1 MAG: hypothetical protein CO058_00825 [candidate division WWE3 bacterium CG_4_9_14_0_2_um_filter_35_11]